MIFVKLAAGGAACAVAALCWYYIGLFIYNWIKDQISS